VSERLDHNGAVILRSAESNKNNEIFFARLRRTGTLSVRAAAVVYVCFYPRDTMLARVRALCPSVCLSVSVGVLTKEMNGLIWFSAWRIFSTSPTLCFKEIKVSAKQGYFAL